MTDYNQHSPSPNITHKGSDNPTDSEVGAKLLDLYQNQTTGVIFSCTNDTFGSQVWLGSDGNIIGLDILATDNPNLVLMYTMDNVSGSTIIDESPNSNDGTNIGGTLFGTGIDGNGLNITSLSVGIDASGVGALTDRTASMWLKNPDNTGNRYALYSKDNVGANANGATWSLRLSSSGNITGYYRDWNGSTYGQLTTTLPVANTWFHVAFSSDSQGNSDSQKLYINGVESGAVPSDNTLSSTSIASIQLAQGISFPRSTGLQIDQVRVFNRAITPAEAAALAAEFVIP